LFRAETAGQLVATASRLSIAASVLITVILIVSVVVVTAVWDHRYERIGKDFEVAINRTHGEAWNYLYGDSLLDGIGRVFLLLPIGISLFVLLSGFTHWIDVHRHGHFTTSLGLSLRTASVSLWPALGLITICCALGLLVDYYWWSHPEMSKSLESWPVVVVPGIPACGFVMASWMQRAIASAKGSIQVTEHPPRCEGCGYDLSHRPTSGLCPECGLSIDESLLPNRRRPGSLWERQGDVTAWLATIVTILFSPKRFYEQLQLRSPLLTAGRFQRALLVAIGLGASAWALFLFIFVAPYRGAFPVLVFFVAVASLWPAFIGWGLQRLVMAFVFADWIRRHALPDFGWARKVFSYESAFLLAFCLFDAFFVTLMIATDGRGISTLMEAWLGHRLYILGAPPEPVVLFVGNAALCCVWIWRYYIALVAIRWSNF